MGRFLKKKPFSFETKNDFCLGWAKKYLRKYFLRSFVYFKVLHLQRNLYVPTAISFTHPLAFFPHSPVWPDLTKFRHLGCFLKSLEILSVSLLSIV